MEELIVARYNKVQHVTSLTQFVTMLPLLSIVITRSILVQTAAILEGQHNLLAQIQVKEAVTSHHHQEQSAQAPQVK
jgi:hypothetical protein